MPNNFNGLLQNPAFMMGAGILGNNSGHYGAFGPAFGKGVYQAGVMSNRQQEMQMRMQEAKQREQLFKLQLEKAKRLAEKEKTARKVSKGLLARPPVDQSGTYSMGGYTQEGGDLYPGEQPIQGLLNQSPFEKDPTKATLEYYSEIGDFEGLMDAQLQLANREGKNYTNDYKNYLQTTNDPTPEGFGNFLLTQKKAGASIVDVKVGQPSQGERTTSGKLHRMLTASEEMNRLYGPEGQVPMGFLDRLATDWLPSQVQSLVRSEQGTRIAAVENAWMNIHARDESGAAIPKHEWPMWQKVFFGLPGDGQYTVQLKGRLRQAVEGGMTIREGRAVLLREGIDPEKYMGKYSFEDIKSTATKRGISQADVMDELWKRAKAEKKAEK